MRDVTESDERAKNLQAWICDRCKHERQTIRRRRYAKAHAGNLYGIKRHHRSPKCWEARIAGGKSGVWIYIGLYATLAEAVRARDEALARRARAA